MYHIREIRKEDNEALAEIIREAMTSFNADPKTTILGDAALLTMYENYQEEGAEYFVVEYQGRVVGGCGIKQLDGSREPVCELQRMFLSPDVRGKGIGKSLIDLCLNRAKELGYKKVYLESLKNMHSAIALYQRSGFEKINAPLGNTGHGGCDVFMMKEL